MKLVVVVAIIISLGGRHDLLVGRVDGKRCHCALGTPGHPESIKLQEETFGWCNAPNQLLVAAVFNPLESREVAHTIPREVEGALLPNSGQEMVENPSMPYMIDYGKYGKEGGREGEREGGRRERGREGGLEGYLHFHGREFI